MHQRTAADRIDTRHDCTRRGPLVMLAGSALLLGTLLYMFGRPAGAAWLLPAPLQHGLLLDLGAAGHGLPTLLHAYAFVLLCAAALRPHLPALGALCAGWFTLETLFELGQHPAIARLLEAALPAGSGAAPGVGQVMRYFQHGVFDPLDIACALLGVVAAGVTVFLVTQPRRDHHEQTGPRPR